MCPGTSCKKIWTPWESQGRGFCGRANACSAWFREVDSKPGAIFRTLRFALDLPGEHDVRESRDSGAVDTSRSPYVAKVFQGEGRYATVTINGNGAFFSSLA